MFTKLTIKNFQSHKALVFNLDPHITTIIGPNDAGKSAVLRALRWVCMNKPSGVRFIKRGQSVAHVKLLVDGHTISRRRSEKLNSYSLDGEDLRAFKSDVPDPIKELLKVADINFQGQHDSPFWFSLTSGQISREINQIVNLEAIDRVQSKIASRIKREKTIADVTRERILTAKELRKELEWTKEADRDLRRVESLERKLTKARENTGTLAELLEAASEYTRQIKRFGSSIEQATASVKILDAIAKRWSTVGKRRILLDSLIQTAEQETKKCQNLKTGLSNAEMKLAKIKRCPMCGRVL